MSYARKIYNYANRSAWYLNHFGLKRIIYSAGIPRSGSTLLYNILRTILIKKFGDDLTYGWIGDAETMQKSKINLIKTHEVNRIDYWRAYQTFFTYRDIRDVLVSRYRMFNKKPTYKIAKYHITNIELAKKRANLVLKYEDMLSDRLKQIPIILETLKIDLDPEWVLIQLPDPKKVTLKNDYHHEKTLLHANHITGTKKNEWKEILSPELQDQLLHEYEWWFRENGYEV